jgi:radical SAM superfamily enzyme YgiQ (UPF0313 family)
MRILLVSPRSDSDQFKEALEQAPSLSSSSRGKKTAHFAPYSLLAIAGLTPDEHEVELHDEQVRGHVDPVLAEGKHDIVGISVMTNQLKRTLQIARACKACGIRAVVAGGAGTAHLSQEVRQALDVVFVGEAEYTWPRFLKEFESGQHRRVYRQVSKVDLADTPIPRWDLLAEDLPCYWSATVQTNRGCPHDCAFCDSIYIYGRKVRTRRLDHVLAEIRTLADMGTSAILIADDNFCGDRPFVKRLLRELAAFNNSLKAPLGFITQADVTIARDDELLELLADCNFIELALGIESPRPESLRCINKKQNLGQDAVEAVLKVQSYGIPVLATMIAGTDADDLSVFDSVRDFLKAANVIDHALWPLMAPGGTPLWYQLKKEGRLVQLLGESSDRLGIVTNIVPKQMSRVDFLRALADYWESAYDPDAYAERAIALLRAVRRPPKIRKPGWGAFWKRRKVMLRMALFYLFRTPKDVRRALLRTLRVAWREARFMLPKIMLVQTSFMMGRARSKLTAKLAREEAQREADHPEKVRFRDRSLPVPESLREHAGEVVGYIYPLVRGKAYGREALYKSCLAALTEFVHSRGDRFEELDEEHRAILTDCCERALLKFGAQDGPADASDFPEDAPPKAFVREMLDALDLNLRMHKAGADAM